MERDSRSHAAALILLPIESSFSLLSLVMSLDSCSTGLLLQLPLLSLSMCRQALLISAQASGQSSRVGMQGMCVAEREPLAPPPYHPLSPAVHGASFRDASHPDERLVLFSCLRLLRGPDADYRSSTVAGTWTYTHTHRRTSSASEPPAEGVRQWQLSDQ